MFRFKSLGAESEQRSTPAPAWKISFQSFPNRPDTIEYLLGIWGERSQKGKHDYMMRPRRAPGLTDWVQVAVVTLDESTRSPHKNVNIRQSSNTGSINGLKVQCEGFGGW